MTKIFCPYFLFLNRFNFFLSLTSRPPFLFDCTLPHNMATLFLKKKTDVTYSLHMISRVRIQLCIVSNINMQFSFLLPFQTLLRRREWIFFDQTRKSYLHCRFRQFSFPCLILFFHESLKYRDQFLVKEDFGIPLFCYTKKTFMCTRVCTSENTRLWLRHNQYQIIISFS